MNDKNPQLSSAYRLGCQLEAQSALSRKAFALNRLRQMNPTVPEDRLPDTLDAHLENHDTSLLILLDRIKSLLPLRLIYAIEQLAQKSSEAFGGSDPRNDMLLHAAIAGLIDEATLRGSTWHSLQLGRFIQRARLLLQTIYSAIKDQKLPEKPLLVYVALQAESPEPDLSSGTYLWNLHHLFQNLLKASNNPKSLESTFMRMGLHIEGLPQPEDLKKDFEKLSTTQNRVLNDLTFVDVHELIGDDPQDHFSNILDFFSRQKSEVDHLYDRCNTYLTIFETYIQELADQECFEYEL